MVLVDMRWLKDAQRQKWDLGSRLEAAGCVDADVPAPIFLHGSLLPCLPTREVGICLKPGWKGGCLMG